MCSLIPFPNSECYHNCPNCKGGDWKLIVEGDTIREIFCARCGYQYEFAKEYLEVELDDG